MTFLVEVDTDFLSWMKIIDAFLLAEVSINRVSSISPGCSESLAVSSRWQYIEW